MSWKIVSALQFSHELFGRENPCVTQAVWVIQVSLRLKVNGQLLKKGRSRQKDFSRLQSQQPSNSSPWSLISSKLVKLSKVNIHAFHGEKCVEIIKTLHVKLYLSGAPAPSGSVTVKNSLEYLWVGPVKNHVSKGGKWMLFSYLFQQRYSLCRVFVSNQLSFITQSFQDFS